MQLKPVEEQVVVVMGASSGIGRDTALQFADSMPRSNRPRPRSSSRWCTSTSWGSFTAQWLLFRT